MKKSIQLASFPLLILTAVLLFGQYATSHPAQTSLDFTVGQDKSIRQEKTVAQEKAPIDWDNMSRSERKAYMRDEVMPKMEHAFAAFDAKKYGHIKCVTCHGDGARSGEYKMPNPKLPKLPNSAEGFKKLGEKNPKMMKFMSDVVKPDMAALLGMKPYDPKTKTGFSCGNCHTTAK